jgi:hypothetical protein
MVEGQMEGQIAGTYMVGGLNLMEDQSMEGSK